MAHVDVKKVLCGDGKPWRASSVRGGTAPVYAQEVGTGTDDEFEAVVVVARADGVLLLALFSECDDCDGDRDCPLVLLVGRDRADVHEAFVVDSNLRMEGATAIVGCASRTDLRDGRFSIIAPWLLLLRHAARKSRGSSRGRGVGPRGGRTEGQRERRPAAGGGRRAASSLCVARLNRHALSRWPPCSGLIG